MVGGIDLELEERLDVPSRTVDLQDGDRVKVIGPVLDMQQGYTFHLYRNNDTRALDEKFGLNGEPIPEDFVRSIDSTSLAVGQADLGNIRVSSTLAFFVNATYKTGYCFGFREDDIRKINPPYFHPELALEHTNGDQKPYLVRKEVDSHYVLFPRGLPLESMALPDKAVA